MVKNLVFWESNWEYAQDVAKHLKDAEERGKIQHLCFMPDGRACFRSEERADDFIRLLSEWCEGKVITHSWADEDDCASVLYQDGRESRSVPPRKSPGWQSLMDEVADITKRWEDCADFQNKLDACWQRYREAWRGLDLDQSREQAAEFVATGICYERLRKLSWQKTWIACLNQLTDPLAVVRDAWLHTLCDELQEKIEQAQSDSLRVKFEQVLCDIADQQGMEQKCGGMEACL